MNESSTQSNPLVSTPPIRKKIFRHSLMIMSLYIAVEAIMMLIFLFNGVTTHTIIIGFVLFVFTIVGAFFLADNLAVRIATPLRELSKILRRKPSPGTKLKVPQPSTLEMRILSHELLALWKRVSDLQKLNLEEISSHRKKLETVLTSVDDAIIVLDNQDKIGHCNEGMLKLLNFPLEEMIDKSWPDLPLMIPNYIKLRDLLKPDISSDRTLELEINGAFRIFSGRCRAIFNEANEQIGNLYLLHDITEIRQKDRVKSEFIAVLSHELKTPLQSLEKASELLLAKTESPDNPDNNDEKNLVQTIHEDVKRIKGVANEFIQVGLINLHSLKLKLEQVAINEHLQRWIQPFQVLAKDRNVRIEFIKEGSDIITAKIDTVKFPWAITNLLSNAIRVSPQDSIVTIYLSDRERMIDIEVRDQGPGIPDSAQARMFDPFFQFKQAAEEKTAGFLGLGLTITKEVVEAHGGIIEYFPCLPRGSTFRIRLPIV